MLVYNADGQILGRLCSVIAKQLLKGESVTVVNAEKAVVSGNPKATKEQYLEKVRRGDPYKGPFFPSMPDVILRRTVRGMLPWHKPNGRKAYRKLKVFIGVPDELTKEKFEKVDAADAKRLRTKSMTLGELSLSIGGKKRW
jgi:large subunit ribosomal protein L13